MKPGKDRSFKPFTKDKSFRPQRSFDRHEHHDRHDRPQREQEPREARAERYEKPVEVPKGVATAYLRSFHYDTFIYEKMLAEIEGKPEDGDLVAVKDKNGKFFGWAFYNSQSGIILRMVSRETSMPTDDLLRQRIARAVAFRRDILKLDSVTDAYRLVHAEGDGLTGLIADKFGDYVVIELFSLAMHRRLAMIEDAFIDAGVSVKGFLLRADKSIAQQEGIVLGKHDEPKTDVVTIEEQGVKFAIDLKKGHKTGFFCDQRDNRQTLTKFTPGKRVLDVCCYTGGFAVYAAGKGKASSVTAVDLDEKALELAEENAKLNHVRIDFTHMDAFNFLRQAAEQGQQWDVVVVDPSKFVAKRIYLDQGLQKYADLNRLAASVVAPGGIMVTCSCSGPVDQTTFVQTVERATRSAGRTMQIFSITGAGPDHPFQADTPEGQYLKVVWGRVL